MSQWWQDHGDQALLVAGLIVAGFCIAASFGACAIATVAVAAVTIADGKAYRGWSNEDAIGYGTVTVLTLGIGSSAMAAMKFEGMSAQTILRVDQNAAKLGFEPIVVPRTAYIGTGVTTNLPGTMFAGINSSG